MNYYDEIKNNEFGRLNEKTKYKLANNNNFHVEDFIKNPILIKNSYNYIDIITYFIFII